MSSIKARLWNLIVVEPYFHSIRPQVCDKIRGRTLSVFEDRHLAYHLATEVQ